MHFFSPLYAIKPLIAVNIYTTTSNERIIQGMSEFRYESAQNFKNNSKKKSARVSLRSKPQLTGLTENFPLEKIEIHDFFYYRAGRGFRGTCRICRPANLWSSKTVFFKPQSCILKNKHWLLRGSMPLTVPTYRKKFVNGSMLNMHDFVSTVVFDEPINIPKCEMGDACRIL